MFNREAFFDSVRPSLFGGAMTQEQVDGLNAILDAWETEAYSVDLRWCANGMAQTYHETGATMQPIEEWGKGEGQPYGVPDPETGETYYGRGFIQLTWRENYRRADDELLFVGPLSLEYNPEKALDYDVASEVMFRGMCEGWFRSDDEGPHNLARYFNVDTDDAYNARDIINGDKTYRPDWANGKSIGELIEAYHRSFFLALEASWFDGPYEEPIGFAEITLQLSIEATPGVIVHLHVNKGDL